MGQVIGQSTRDAGEAASAPVKIPNLISTVLHSVLGRWATAADARCATRIDATIGQCRADSGVLRTIALKVSKSWPWRPHKTVALGETIYSSIYEVRYADGRSNLLDLVSDCE